MPSTSMPERTPERSGLTLYEQAVLQRLFNLENRVAALESREVTHEENSLNQFNRASDLEQRVLNIEDENEPETSDQTAT